MQIHLNIAIPDHLTRRARILMVVGGLCLSTAVFAISDGDLAWIQPNAPLTSKDLLTTFKKVQGDITSLQGAQYVPSGSVQAYAGIIDVTHPPPTGWVLCDGSEYEQTDAKYAPLFAALGTSHGTSGAGKFNVPDYRGRFLRGTVDISTTARDPDVSSRTAMNPGGGTGTSVGSVEGQATSAGGLSTGSSTVSGIIGPDGVHEHAIYVPNGPTPDNLRLGNEGPLDGWVMNAGLGWANQGSYILRAHTNMDGVSSAHSHGHSLTAAAQTIYGQNETRPVNAYVNYIVKL